ncbi:MAG: COQ9 family protein [Rhodobacteraceae bacterium]|nr:COQ9 family protein [Paracoccaceae bacterium]
MTNPTRTARDALLDAALPHVPFDGWSDATFDAAIKDSEVDPTLAHTLFPKRGVDLALALHARGDEVMAKRLREADLSELRFRDRVATAIRYRIEAAHSKDTVRRGSTLFALPQNAASGAKALWDTADAIWTALDDASTDYNWYTKRATLSGVYGASVLFWLGDDSTDCKDTWEFVDRRIDDVMEIEKAKGWAKSNAVMKALGAGPAWLASKVQAPAKMPRMDIPGVFTAQPDEPDTQTK